MIAVQVKESKRYVLYSRQCCISMDFIGGAFSEAPFVVHSLASRIDRLNDISSMPF